MADGALPQKRTKAVLRSVVYPWSPFPPRRARPGPGPHKSRAATCEAQRTLASVRHPPWRQPRCKSMVSLVNSHTNATRVGWHLWDIDLRFAPGLPPGRLRAARAVAPLPSQERNTSQVATTFTWKPRPGSGFDCLICAEFARQRNAAVPRRAHI